MVYKKIWQGIDIDLILCHTRISLNGETEMKAKVTGRGAFPIDMLRYDDCVPLTEVDAGIITRSILSFDRWTVHVAKNPRQRNDGFTERRWESFGCTIEVQKG